jgi:DNA-binding GntR family transcriptional regulator
MTGRHARAIPLAEEQHMDLVAGVPGWRETDLELGAPFPAGSDGNPLERTGARDLVHRAMQRAIIRGDVEPGSVISVQEVADRFHVSRMPVREAIGVLVSDGLARRAINGRVLVAPMSVRDASELYAVRIALEELALDEAVAHVDDAALSRLGTSLADARADEHEVRSAEAGREFHEAIIRLSGNATLIAILGVLGLRIDRYRYFSTRFGSGRPAAAGKEHRAVYDALAAREWQQAREAWHAHLSAARTSVVGALVALGYDSAPASARAAVPLGASKSGRS